MKIAILVPTIYRPEGLRRSLQSLVDSLFGSKSILEHRIDVIVAAEKDDTKAVEIAHEFGVQITFCEDKQGGPAYGWNTALKAAKDYDMYFTGSDDIEFTSGWLDEVLRVLNDELNGSGLVGINDNRWDKAQVMRMCATHYLMTRDFVIEEMGGVVAQPFYFADYTDMEACARARRVDKFAWAEHALVKHHWKGPQGDLGYKNASAKRPQMKPLYEQRKAKGFPNDFERILS